MKLHRTLGWMAILGAGGAFACGTRAGGTGPSESPAGADTAANGSTTGDTPGGGGGAGTSAGAGAGAGAGAAQGGGQGGTTHGSTGSGGAITDGGAPVPPTPHMGNTCLKPGAADFATKGPYTVTKSSVDLGPFGELPDAGPTTYAIFTPSPLNDNCPHPVVAWGNGTGVTGSSTTTPAGACTGTDRKSVV